MNTEASNRKNIVELGNPNHVKPLFDPKRIVNHVTIIVTQKLNGALWIIGRGK